MSEIKKFTNFCDEINYVGNYVFTYEYKSKLNFVARTGIISSHHKKDERSYVISLEEYVPACHYDIRKVF